MQTALPCDEDDDDDDDDDDVLLSASDEFSKQTGRTIWIFVMVLKMNAYDCPECTGSSTVHLNPYFSS